MKTILACFLFAAFMPLSAIAGAPPDQTAVKPGSAGPAVDEWAQAEPPPRPEPPPGGERPAHERGQPGPGPRPPMPPPGGGPGPLPPPGGAPGPGGQAGPGGPGGGRPDMLHPPLPPFAPLMRIIAERRPELAERLERLRRRDPHRLEQVLMDALMMRIEQTLDEAEANSAERPEPPQAWRGEPGSAVRPPEREADRHMRELYERQQQLERRSHELAERVRQARTAEGGKEPAEKLQAELRDVVEQQFDVRGEIRKTEVEQIKQQLERLRQRIDELRQDLDHRDHERQSIIERRLQQLLGDEGSGW
jgi:hypothetical protein